MPDSFADALKTDLRLDARRVFIAAYRQVEEEFRTSPVGGVKHGRRGGSGRVPRDEGDLQTSLRVDSIQVSTDLMSCVIEPMARNPRTAFNYPAFLESAGTVGGPRANGRSRKHSTARPNIHFEWFTDWMNDKPSGDDRWSRVLNEQFDRIGS